MKSALSFQRSCAHRVIVRSMGQMCLNNNSNSSSNNNNIVLKNIIKSDFVCLFVDRALLHNSDWPELMTHLHFVNAGITDWQSIFGVIVTLFKTDAGPARGLTCARRLLLSLMT